MRLIRHHGLGNDYLVLESGPSLTPDLVRAICDRHTGVGSDGILEPVRPSLAGADHTVRIWNPDGSIAEKSGNGIRIFARWAAQGPPETMSIHTTFDLVHAWVTGDDVRVEMGRARFGASEIPALNSRIDQPIPEVERPVVAVGVGNPHCVTFIDAFPEDWAALGARIEVHPWFPNRTNVQFARVIGPDTVEIRIWERGAGVTSASGSSSCAVAAAAVRTGRLQAGRITVVMPGGTLHVTVREDWGLVLEGPVERVATIDVDPAWLSRRV